MPEYLTKVAINVFLDREVIESCTTCTTRGYYFYRIRHHSMNETFICFDTRHLLRPETQIIDFAINPKECTQFPIRVNANMSLLDPRAIGGKELDILLEIGQNISSHVGYDGCLPPLLGIQII